MALAICSRRAADVFLYPWPGSLESVVLAVFVDATDALEGFAPSCEVADDLCEAVDAFLGVCAAAVLLSDGTDGFLNKPLTDGFLVGLAATVLEPDLCTATSWARLSGLGVLDRRMGIALGDCIPYIEARTGLTDVVFEGVWKD